jgi:general nucleoside transport system ATP-binding protein
MPGVTMDGITKFFPSSAVLANDTVSLRVEDREIHALVGENGAGKSTLMRILYGLEVPDEGTIRLGSNIVRIANPAAANDLGIGMVHQHFTTIPEFSVTENVALGVEPRVASFFFDRGRAEREVAEVIAANGFHIDPRASASALTVGERQQLEIVKLLYRKADVLILDEPTAVLTEQEIQSLFVTLRRLRELGKTIIIITHKVREVKEIADSVTVMRHGKSVARVETKDVDEAGIACLMMGEGACSDFDSKLQKDAPGPEVFSMRSVSLFSRGRPRPLIDKVSFSLRSGEVLGLCGVVGNGLGELEDLISGFARPSSGEILLEGLPLERHRKPRLGYVPADRMRRGSCLEAPVLENLVALDRKAYFPRGFSDRRKSRAFAMEAIDRFSIAAKPEVRVGSLSGGNIQKVIIARELAGDASFLLFSNPTWGLDIASMDFVYESLLKAKTRGAAILLISANLDEILTLSDRVSVMYKGRIVCMLENKAGLSRERLGEYMLGLRSDNIDADKIEGEDASGKAKERPHGRA